MTKPSARSQRPAFQIRWPEEIRDQVSDYAEKMGIPVNAVLLGWIDTGLKRAGWPGVTGPGVTTD